MDSRLFDVHFSSHPSFLLTQHGGRSPPKDGHQEVLDILLDDKALQELSLKLEFRERLVNDDTITDQGPHERTRVPVCSSLVVECEPVGQVHGRAEQ